MPRHNPARDTPEPLGSADVPKTWEQINAEREAKAARFRERTVERRKKRIAAAISWSHCLVPTCEGQIHNPATIFRDPDQFLPLCVEHEVTVWQGVQRQNRDPEIIRTAEERFAAAVHALGAADKAAQEKFLARQSGHIYFVRVNGLIKAGWSRDVHGRLRAYGPLVEVLCIYPGTRQDETNLHRQLRPALVRGREWYEDGPILADFVAAAVEKYGPPVVYDDWTKPKQNIKPRKRSG